MTTENECNCWIGILNSYDQSSENYIHLKDYIQKITQKVKTIELCNQHGIGNEPPSKKSFIDRRYGYSLMFYYCPDCGKKIDWKTIRKELK